MISDADARRAIAEDLDDTLVVEAAAGTGKTTELVNRILAVLEHGRATMIEIVAVTFTEKAAGELKLRLRERLEDVRAKAGDAVVRERLDAALETLEEAHVNTIHGFCADLLRERPVEARVDPLFAVLTEPQAGRLYERAFRAWLQDALREPPEGLRRALRRTAAPAFGGGDANGPIDRLRNAGRALAEWRDFPTAWRRPPFARDAEIDRLVADLHRLADLTAAGSRRDNLFVDTDGVRRLSRQIRLEESFGRRDYDAWEARLVDLVRDRGFSRTRKGSGYKYGKDVTRTEVLAGRDQLFAALQQFRKEADADLAACLQQELAGATARYQELKAAAGSLDFADLLVRARDLIKSDADVRRHLQRKFARIFVDEFQDTDPIQAEILLLLAADDPATTDCASARPVAGKLFIVGDPKQAIYRFRGTDVATYWRVARQLETSGGRLLQLTKSYRSLPAIQRFVNTAFASSMTGDARTLQADYVPLAPHRDDDNSQPAVVALPVPNPYAARGPLKASARAIEASLPDAVGAFIAWLTDERNGWQVVERGADNAERRVPLAARHIAVLFRRFVSFGEDVTRTYIDAIEARGIPHLLVGGKAFHDREEVETIRAALAAIEWPDDELSVFATLSGSLFAVDDRAAARVPASVRIAASVPRAARARRELGAGSGADGRADDAPDADRRRPSSAPAAASTTQLPAGRRHHRPAARRNARARGIHPEAGWRAGAGERPSHRRARAAIRSGGRHLVSGLHRRAPDRVGARGGRSADPRREQRRRAADDGAQGQGPRVSGGHPRRYDLPAEPQRREPVSRSRVGPLRDADRRLVAARAARSRGRGSGARSRGRHPAGLCRRHARARPARRAGARRRTVGGRLVVAAQRRAVSAVGREAHAGAGSRNARHSGRKTPSCSGPTRKPRRRRPLRPAPMRSPRAAIPWCGGIPAPEAA